MWNLGLFFVFVCRMVIISYNKISVFKGRGIVFVVVSYVCKMGLLWVIFNVLGRV